MTEPQAPQEPGARTAAVAAALFLMTAAFMLAKTGRDALYLQARGVYSLPFAYLGIALLSVPMALVTLGVLRRAGPRRTRLLGPLALAVALTCYFGLARPGGGVLMTGFFVLVPLAFGVLFSVTWLLLADLLDGAPRGLLAQAYGRVGAASILGGLAGASLAKALSAQIAPRALLLSSALGLLASTSVVAWAQRRFPARRSAGAYPAVAPPAPFGAGQVLRQPYALLLLLAGMAGALVGVLVEFQLYLAAAASGRSGQENASFFAGIYMVLNAGALLVQLFLLPALQRRIGLSGSLHVLPATLLFGAASLLASASLSMRSLLRVAEGGLKASIHRVSWEQAFLPLGQAQRAAAKVLIDGAGARVAEGLGALLLWAWLALVVRGASLEGRDVSWITWVLLGAAVLWVFATRRLAAGLGLQAVAAPDAALVVPLPDT